MARSRQVMGTVTFFFLLLFLFCIFGSDGCGGILGTKNKNIFIHNLKKTR
jgi:hypothetical protein